MGFSIGGLLSGVASVFTGTPLGGAATIAGAAIGGGSRGSSVGPLASSTALGRLAIRSGFIGSGAPASQIPISLRLPPPSAAARTLPFLEGFFGNGNGGGIGDILRRAREATGRSVTSRAIKEAARVCGMDTAAATFGISVEDVCFVVVHARRRRSRGISASDLRRTRSTIRKITTMQKNLKALSMGRR